MVKIKICGLSRMCDIDSVNAAKPDYIGFVFAKSRRLVDSDQAAELRSKLSPEITPVGVFVNEKPEIISSLIERGIVNIVQLHGDEDEEYIARIKFITGAPVIKAVTILKSGDAQEWEKSCADYLLLDNRGGGTGQSFDWNLIGKIQKPFFLAGGLNIDNIKSAIDQTYPFAVDISSGVETDGFKDGNKIKSIIRGIRNE